MRERFVTANVRRLNLEAGMDQRRKRPLAVAAIFLLGLGAFHPGESHAGCLKPVLGFTLLGAGIWAVETSLAGNTSKVGEATLIGAGLGLLGGLLFCAVVSDPPSLAASGPAEGGCWQKLAAASPGSLASPSIPPVADATAANGRPLLQLAAVRVEF